MRACEACGREFEAKRGNHRFCSATCRKRGKRGATVVALDGGDVIVGGLEDATQRQLAAAGRESCPAGVNALLLARRLDQAGDTGSAVAALSRQHLAALEAALEGAEPAGDPVDELRHRRERRLSG